MAVQSCIEGIPVKKRIGYKKKWNKKIEDPNHREEIKKNLSHPLPIKVFIKNQNNNNSRLCDTKKLKEQIIVNKIELSKVKANVLLKNSI